MGLNDKWFNLADLNRQEFDGGIKLIEMMVSSVVKNGDRHDLEYYRERLEDLANMILDISESMQAEDDFIYIPKIVRKL